MTFSALRDLLSQFDDDDDAPLVPPPPGAPAGLGGGLDASLARMTVRSDTQPGRAQSLFAADDAIGKFGRGATIQRQNFPSLFVNTSDPDDYNTPLGQQSATGDDQFTIVDSVSGGITIASTASAMSVTTLHSIFVLSTDSTANYLLCLKHVGAGVSACIRKQCTINHRGWTGQRHVFPPGTIAVLKDKSTVFISPVSNVQDISEEVLSDWQSGPRRSLSEWVTLFQAAENAKAVHGFVTSENLASEATFQTYASRFRSPRPGISEEVDSSSKFGSFQHLSDDLQAALKRKSVDTINEAQAAIDPTSRKRILLTGNESASDSLYILEKSIEATKDVISAITRKMDEKSEMVGDELRVVLSRTQAVENVIGEPVANNNTSLQAPTLWASIALLTSAIDEIHQVVNALPRATLEPYKQEINGTIRTMEIVLKEAIGEATSSLRSEADKSNYTMEANVTALSESMIVLARNANSMKRDLRALKTRASTGGEQTGDGVGSVSNPSTEVLVLQKMVSDLTLRIDSLVEDRASKAAKFFGITLRNGKECNEWVVQNLEDDHLGIIVDVHLVFEHLFNQAYAGDGVLKTLQGLYKVQIDTITQGLACSSFDTRIPKFLKHHKAAVATTETVVKKADPNKSALDRITSWADWDESNSGKRALLEAHLAEFKMTHSMLLNDIMMPGTPAYNAGLLSASASTNWITDLISYIDRTYREFHSESGFTTERAWFIVSHDLVHRIFIELSDPRVGVLGLLRLKSNAKTTQLITWPVVQCHEVMKTFERSKFKDHPCISNEYVKFIMTNSSADGISAKVTALQESVKEITKTVKSASTSAVTASNGVTEAKKLIADLTKKVDAIKQK